MQTDLITKVYFNEHLTHSCVGMPQGLQALSSSLFLVKNYFLLQALFAHMVLKNLPEKRIWTHIV